MNSVSCESLQGEDFTTYQGNYFLYMGNVPFKYKLMFMVTVESFCCVCMHVCGPWGHLRWQALGTIVLSHFSVAVIKKLDQGDLEKDVLGHSVLEG